MGRPAKYTTEEEKRKARCEAVKRCVAKKKPPKEPKSQTEEPRTQRKRGRPIKYTSEEERAKNRKQQNREKAYIYYEKNAEKILQKQKYYYQENRVKILSKRSTKTAPDTFEECVKKLKDIWKIKKENNKITVLRLEFEELAGLNEEKRKEAKQERIDEWKDNYEEIKGFYDDNIPFSFREFLEVASQAKFIEDVWKDKPEKTEKQKEHAREERKRINDIFLKGERSKEDWIYVIAYQYINGIQPSIIERGIREITKKLKCDK